MADSEKRAQLILSIKEAGAKETAAEIQKINTTTVSLQTQLGKLSRADQLEKLGAEMGTLAKKTGNVGQAVDDLNKKLVALGANKDEIESVAGAFSNAQNASEGNGQGGNLLQRGGTALRGLPSIQIPGTGIGTDAIANITRLTGALGEASGATGLMATATTALTPVLGATGAAVGGVIAVAGPLVLIVGALGLAIKAFADQAAAESKAINAIVDAQRAVSDEIAEGLTTDEATKKLDELNKKREAEAAILARNQQVYNENIENQGLLTGALKLTSGAEQALADQIQKSKDIIAANETETNALTQALGDGTLAANDAAEAEKKLAEERTKATLDSAEAAGKELAAQQKALAATEEQNNKRLESIDNEKAVIQAQIDVLTASGDTSEEVSAKIAALTGSLGSLGKESQFITDVALEASRAADAEKKAKKDAEDAAKKAAQAQEAYTKAVASANLSLKNAQEDIGTRFRQTLENNLLKENRDLDTIGTKFRQDQFDLEVKAYRSERDAQQDQIDDLANIRKDANKDEQQALQDGDFKALFLAREKAKETLIQEQTTIDQSKAKREQSARDAQEDLLRSAQRQRQARVLSYEQQNLDARTAQRQDLQQAALTRKRALQIASEGQNAELVMRGQFWNAALAQTQAAQNQILKIMQGGGQAKGPNQSSSPYAGGFQSSFTTAIRK